MTPSMTQQYVPVFTPTEQRIIDVLSDGRTHPRSELKDCLNDEAAVDGTLASTLSHIRKKLAPLDQTIICTLVGSYKVLSYQHVRLLHTSNGSPKG